MGSEEICLEVYDEDMIGKDDPLGKTKLHLSQIVNQRKIVNNWIPLQQCKSGEVLFSAEFAPFVAHEAKPEVAKKETSRPASPTKNVAKEKTPVKEVVPTPTVKPKKTVPLPKGTITVILHKARELEKKGKFGKADPYAVLNVGKEKFKSKTVNNNHNPEWNFDIKFDIDNETSKEVILEVYDEDMIGKDDLLGQTKLNLIQIINQRKIVNNWIPLQQCKSGEVLFSTE